MTDRPFLGILLMLGFCVLAPLGDATAKILGDEISTGFLVFVRFCLQALLLLPFVWFAGHAMPRGKHLVMMTGLRTILHIGGVGFMFASLQFLPLADAISIAFVMPFILLLLGKVFLDEEIGPHRLTACAVGFIGTLLVVQPNFVNVGAPALLPVAVAVIFSLFMLVTRKIAKDVDPIGMQALSGLMAIPVLAGALFIFSDVAFFEITPMTQTDIMLLAFLGTLGTVAHLLMTWSLRFAPSATVAPVQYLEIPIGTVIGFFVFRDFPNGLAAIGITITIAAGLYIILREQAIARRSATMPVT